MSLKIGNMGIGAREKVFIIAELSANHGHDIEIAKNTIKAAYEAGANAIKLQTYTPDTITIDCDSEVFKVKGGTVWDGRTLYQLYSEAFTPWEWHEELFNYARSLGLICFSSPFDKSAVDFLEELDSPAYKVASFEIVDIPLIEYIASKGKPIIISTGIASLCDIELAVEACRRVGNDQIILLKCTSQYPARIEDANLKTMHALRETFDVEVGLSDHTLGTTVPIVSVAMGAVMIEKHFILDRGIGGPDSTFSLDQKEFQEMVLSVRQAELCLGRSRFGSNASVRPERKFARSLFAVKDIDKGEQFTQENIRSIRPGDGLAPKYLPYLLTRHAREPIPRGTPLDWTRVD